MFKLIYNFILAFEEYIPIEFGSLYFAVINTVLVSSLYQYEFSNNCLDKKYPNFNEFFKHISSNFNEDEVLNIYNELINSLKS